MKLFGFSLTTIFLVAVAFYLGTRYPNALNFTKRS
jgi:hypothetical protein